MDTKIQKGVKPPPFSNNNFFGDSSYRPFWLLVFFLFFIIGLLLFSLWLCSYGRDSFFVHKNEDADAISPLVANKKLLPQAIQLAIEKKASFILKEERAKKKISHSSEDSNDFSSSSSNDSHNASVTNFSSSPVGENELSFFQNFFDKVKEITITDPAKRAKLEINRTDRNITNLQLLLSQNESDETVEKGVSLIETIGKQMEDVAMNSKVQTDPEILKLQIEQYNRLTLLLQKLEERLSLRSSLRIEDARKESIVPVAINALNTAPNLNFLHNIGLKAVQREVGDDLAELKVIEILTDVQDDLNANAREKLTGLQKELVQSFEKRMLRLPLDVRTRRLQSYADLSYGNPLQELKTFDTIQNFLTDRDLVLNVETLEELAVKRIEERLWETGDENLRERFLNLDSKNPEALQVLEQVKLGVLLRNDEKRKQEIENLEAAAFQKTISAFGTGRDVEIYFQKENQEDTNLLQVTLAVKLARLAGTSLGISDEVKSALQSQQEEKLQNFISNVEKKDFSTVPRRGYNPVSLAADVRILLPSPTALPVLDEIGQVLSSKDKAKLTLALKAETAIFTEHEIFQVNNPTIFENYRQFVENNSSVKKLIQQYGKKNFSRELAKKERIISEEARKERQSLYEKVQQITQAIFVTKEKTSLEQELPITVQGIVTELKDTLPEKSIPALETPADVVLPPVATLPSDLQLAIVEAAKDELKTKEALPQATLDLPALANDLGVVLPSILPGDSLYPAKETLREIELSFITDPVSKIEKIVKEDSEKTLEAAELLRQSESQASVEKAIEALTSVNEDLKTISTEGKELVAEGNVPEQSINTLVGEIMHADLERQNIIDTIENRAHGEDYTVLEKIRTEDLATTSEVLVTLSNNDAAKLTQMLGGIVGQQEESVGDAVKAVEILNEIVRTEPEETQKVLENAETEISKSLEAKLLDMPAETRKEALTEVAENQTGNPVREFEAYEILKDNFQNPETILLTETMKDQAVLNLTERISEIPDANILKEFADTVIGSELQDLKIVIEIEARIDPPENAGVVALLPIQEKIQEVKNDIEQNILENYGDKPEELKRADFFDNLTLQKTPDVTDIETAKEIQNVFERSPEVTTEVITVAQEETTNIINTFVENISRLQTSTNISAEIPVATQKETSSSISTEIEGEALAAKTLLPTPEGLSALVELRAEVALRDEKKIDVAIAIQVDLMGKYLTQEVHEPELFETYMIQITQDPEIAGRVEKIGGDSLEKAFEEKTKTLETIAAKEEMKLNTAVIQVETQIFSVPANAPSNIETSLPQTVQEEIQAVKQTVPVEQIPLIQVSDTKGEVTVAVSVTSDPKEVTSVGSSSSVLISPKEEASSIETIKASEPTKEEPAPAPEVKVEVKKEEPKSRDESSTPSLPGL